jgi:glycosyltransferase involved in cell wall biosynthesis
MKIDAGSHSPRVSVLMTAYNAAPYLSESVDSILAQDIGDWELIVVENGSRDDSPCILERYTDARVRVFALKSNIGRTPALRYAFEQARGEYIAVLDADDVSHPSRLRRQIDFLDRNPEVVLLGTWTTYIDAQGAVTGESTPTDDREALRNELASENLIVHSSAMYRASAARKVGGYPLDMPHAQDFALWLKLVEEGQVAILPERLCRFRILAQSMTRASRYRVDVARDQLHLFARAGRQLPLSPSGRRKNREAVAIARVRYAAALAGSGRWLAAARSTALALLADPAAVLNNRITRAFFGLNRSSSKAGRGE